MIIFYYGNIRNRVPKRGDLGRLINGHSRQTILVEIAKCELVCANWHAVGTYERLRGVAQPG